MVVGAFTSLGEQEAAEPLCSPGKSLYLAGRAPCPGQGQPLPSVGMGCRDRPQRNSSAVWIERMLLGTRHQPSLEITHCLPGGLETSGTQ